MNIRNYFDAMPVNTGRQLEVDLLKGFSVLFMVWVHVVMVLCDESGRLTAAVATLWGGPYAAPMFMICLGIGLAYSRQQSVPDLFRRAASLLGVALAFNAVHLALPWIAACFAMNKPVSFEDVYYYSFYGEILLFASFAYLYFALTRKWRWGLGRHIAFGAACSLLGSALRWKATGCIYIDLPLGYLWGTGSSSLFPFLNWIIFPIAGLCIGKAMRHCRDKRSVYLRLSPICLLLGAGYVSWSFLNWINLFSDERNYFYLNIVDAFFIVLLFIGLLGQNALLLRLFKGWHFPALTRLSRNITAVYCIHWTINAFLGVFIEIYHSEWYFSLASCTMLAVLLVAVSDLLAVLYHKRHRLALPARAVAFKTKQQATTALCQ